MSQFKTSFLDIGSRDLVDYLLKEIVPESSTYLAEAALIEFLKLQVVSFDFAGELFPLLGTTPIPRALLSFPDKVIGVNTDLISVRKRFSVFHEVAHYVLPNHLYLLFVCDNKDFSPMAEGKLEVEANEFAADLMFMGQQFVQEANSYKIQAQTVKELASKYNASFEATARRLVSKTFKEFMLIVFQKAGDKYPIRYCVGSETFKKLHFPAIQGELPQALGEKVWQFSDIGDSAEEVFEIETCRGSKKQFRAELFTNQFNVFALIQPS